MKWDPTLEHVYDRPMHLLRSTAVGYYVWRDGGIEPEMISFLIGDGALMEEDVRAERKQRKRRGEKVTKLSSDSMKDHALLVIWPSH